MNESKNNNCDVQKSRYPSIVELIIVIGVPLLTCLLMAYMITSAQASLIEQAITDVKVEQVTEGSHYTAVVTAVDTSSSTVSLDNDHVIPTDLLKTTPHVDDVLAYTKTFQYELHKRTGMPQKTEHDTFLNVQTVGQVSK